MKAAPFSYHPATSLPDALAALARHGRGAKLLAGGQSLLPALNLRLCEPEVLVDLNGVSELKGITTLGDGLRLGAMVRHAEIERSEFVRARAPLLSEAVRHIAHAAVRNRGTIGGSVVYADPVAEIPACLVALEATLVLTGADGERRIPAQQFFTGKHETAILQGEVLVAVELPGMAVGERQCFLELARRSGDAALAGIACRATVQGGAFSSLRPVFFAVCPRPMVAHHATGALIGGPLDEDALSRAVEALAKDLRPQEDLQATAPMRSHLARTLLRRAVSALLAETVEAAA